MPSALSRAAAAAATAAAAVVGHLPGRILRYRLALLLLLTLALGLTVWGHLALNGTRFHRWEWRRLSGAAVFLTMAAAAVPAFAGHWLHVQRRAPRWIALALLMFSCFALQVAATSFRSGAFDLLSVADVVASPVATSYFMDAGVLLQERTGLRELLSTYPQRMSGFHLHSREKPPGPILYYMAFIAAGGAFYGVALAAGLVIGAVATVSLPATDWLVRTLTGDAPAAFCAATYLALTPALILFFPSFDQWYPIFTCALAGTWVLALRREDVRLSIAFGATLALMVFFAYNMLVLGTFLIGCAAWVLWRRERAAALFLKHSAVGLASVAVIYLALWLASGFDPIATFLSAWRNQQHMLKEWNRPWPQTIPTDLIDFALGSGWISLFLIVCLLARWARDGNLRHSRVALVLICLAQPIIVALTGLLQAETARVWLFLQPLIMLPVGLELARWTVGRRLVAYGCLWLLLALCCQNMTFV